MTIEIAAISDDDLVRLFSEMTARERKFTRRHVIILADIAGLSRQALVIRLEKLGAAPSGTWDWFQANGGITDKQAMDVLGHLTPNPHRKARAE